MCQAVNGVCKECQSGSETRGEYAFTTLVRITPGPLLARLSLVLQVRAILILIKLWFLREVVSSGSGPLQPRKNTRNKKNSMNRKMYYSDSIHEFWQPIYLPKDSATNEPDFQVIATCLSGSN